MKILILSAVEQELIFINRQLKTVLDERSIDVKIRKVRWSQVDLYLSISGIGVVNTALNLGRLIEKIQPDQVMMVGSAGAFRNSGLKSRDVVIGSTEIMAELGLAAGVGIGDGSALNLPGLEQEIDLDKVLSIKLSNAIADTAGISICRLLTVAGVSADFKQADARELNFNAAAENMEGYALALAGKIYNLPVAEVRGISNMAGERDKSKWDLSGANRAAQMLVMNYLETIKC